MKNNQVYSNGYCGIILIANNWLLHAPVGTPSYPKTIPALPTNTLIENNNLWFNGFLSGGVGWPHPADLVWTRLGRNDHWLKNIYTTSSTGILP